MTEPVVDITVPEGEPVILVRRTFAAPRDLVFRAMTTREYLPRWFGPRALRLEVVEFDFRVGGRYHYRLHGPDGSAPDFYGDYLEIEAPSRVVQTFTFGPFPDSPSVETMNLEDRGDHTILTVQVRHKSIEARDGHYHSGMESGMRDTYKRLDELLVTLRE